MFTRVFHRMISHDMEIYIYIYIQSWRVPKRSEPPKKNSAFPILDDGFWGPPSVGKAPFLHGPRLSLGALRSDAKTRTLICGWRKVQKKRGEEMGPHWMKVRIGRTLWSEPGLRRFCRFCLKPIQSWWCILRCEPSFASFFWELSVGFRFPVISVISEGLLQVSGPILVRLWDWRKRMNKKDDVVMCQLL